MEQLKNYLKLISEAAPNTPLLYYHFPRMTNVNSKLIITIVLNLYVKCNASKNALEFFLVHMGQFLESLNDEISTFVGIKFTSSDLDEGTQAFRANNKKYVVFLGNDQVCIIYFQGNIVLRIRR